MSTPAQSPTNDVDAPDTVSPRPMTPEEQALLERLRAVRDPELGGDIVELGMVRRVVASPGGVRVDIALTISGCPMRAHIQREITSRLEPLAGVVRIEWSTMTPEERAACMARARRIAQEHAGATRVPPNCRVVAVSSGKGGVGKSSICSSLALVLAARGHHVGVLDADVTGFSIPRLLGVEGRLEARRVDDTALIIPARRHVRGGADVQVVSMGLLAESESTALLWRGAMLGKALEQMLRDVAWDERLEYLLVDLPPGTSDVSMQLARLAPSCDVLVVTTPSDGVARIAERAADMARRSNLRVLGVVENLSYLPCDSGPHYVFGRGGGEAMAARLGVELLAQVPIEEAMAGSYETGRQADGEMARVMGTLAERLLVLVPPLGSVGCAAGLLERVEAALGPVQRR